MRFTGYAALFDVRDRGGDTIRAGAFAGITAPLPLLWLHDPARRIGVIERLWTDQRGLFVEGRITGAGGTARSAAAMLGCGSITGLSFGYRVRDYITGPLAREGATTRDLMRVDVSEISLVPQPMQPGARVVSVG